MTHSTVEGIRDVALWFEAGIDGLSRLIDASEAIGVIYRPDRERLRHSFTANLPEQFDEESNETGRLP